MSLKKPDLDRILWNRRGYFSSATATGKTRLTVKFSKLWQHLARMLMFRRCRLSVTGLLRADRPCQLLGLPVKCRQAAFFTWIPCFCSKILGSGWLRWRKQQLQAVWTHSRRCDLVVATGDIVAAAIAHASNRPYIIFLSAHSSYYQGQVDLGLIRVAVALLREMSGCFYEICFDCCWVKPTGFKESSVCRQFCQGQPQFYGQIFAVNPPSSDDRPSPSRLREATNNLVLLLELVK